MRLLKDSARHKTMEHWLADRLVADIKITLEAADIEGHLHAKLTTEIALSVAEKWEGVPPYLLEINGEEIAPFLVFGVANDEEDVLVRSYDGMGSFLKDETIAALARTFGAQ